MKDLLRCQMMMTQSHRQATVPTNQLLHFFQYSKTLSPADSRSRPCFYLHNTDVLFHAY